MKANGSSGKLTVGGREVATLGRWSLEFERGVATIKAALQAYNAYWFDHAPSFDVRLMVGAHPMAWRGVTVTREGDDVTIIGRGGPNGS